MLKRLLSNTIDACYCSPLDKCEHDREKRETYMTQWLTKIEKQQNLNNKQGKIYFAWLNNKQVVIKHYNRKCLINHQIREELAGLSLNKLNLPYFVYTFGTMYRKSGAYLVTNFVNGQVLKLFLKNNKINDSFLINIVLQLCIALETAQQKYLFTHYDLHLENVIIQPTTENIQLFNQYECRFEKFIPVILDFGMSCGYNNKTKWGSEGMEKKGILNRIRPGYDLFTFFLYLYAANVKSDFVVDVLENFFKHDVNKPDYYLYVLVKGAEFKIPMQLFNYILEKYKPQNILPRSKFTLEKYKLEACDCQCFLHHVWNKCKLSINTKKPVENTLQMLTQSTVEKNIDNYYKIKQMNLDEFKLWTIHFSKILNEYWKTKIKNDVVYRKKIRFEKIILPKEGI